MEPVIIENFVDYQNAAMRTCTDSSRNMQYMALEVISEAGEVAGKWAKVIRDEGGSCKDEESKKLIMAELGDVMWGVAGIATIHGDSLADSIDLENCKPNFVEGMTMLDYLFSLQHDAVELAEDALFGSDAVLDYADVVDDIVNIANLFHWDLKMVLQYNINKLTDRYNRKVIQGSGDNR